MRLEQPYGKRFADTEKKLEPKCKYFIACEGRKTEYQYFKGLIEARDELHILPLIEIVPIKHCSNTNSHPLNIISETKVEMDTCNTFFPEFDHICIIVDRDHLSFFENQYDEAVKQCENNKFRLIVSNPCIELWLLFHYSDLSKYDLKKILENKKIGNRTQTEVYLKDDYLEGSYSKKRILFHQKYKNHVITAISHSKKYPTEPKKLKSSVGTNLGMLIEEMIEPAYVMVDDV